MLADRYGPCTCRHYVILLNLPILCPFGLVGHEERHTMLGNPLSGQHRQGVHQDECRLAPFEP